MVFKVILTDKAYQDIDGIIDYIIKETKEIRFASNVYSKIDNAIKSLGHMPERNRQSFKNHII